MGLSLVLCGIDGFTLAHYHSVLDAGLLEIVLATNPAEAWEYVTSQAGGIAVAAGMLVAAVVLIELGKRFLRYRNQAAIGVGRVSQVVAAVLAAGARCFSACCCLRFLRVLSMRRWMMMTAWRMPCAPIPSCASL